MTRLQAGQPGFKQGQGIFLFTTMSILALGLSHLPVQWSPGVKQPGHEIDHSPPPIAKVNMWSSTPTLPYIVMT